jgi:hypothetical protein
MEQIVKTRADILVKKEIKGPTKEKVLGFFRTLQQQPIGIQGTHTSFSESILQGGIYKGGHYNIDPQHDSLLIQQLQEEDWQGMYARLVGAIEDAAGWSTMEPLAGGKHSFIPAIFIFRSEPFSKIKETNTAYGRNRFPVGSSNDTRVWPESMIALYEGQEKLLTQREEPNEEKRAEQLEAFAQEVALQMLELDVSISHTQRYAISTKPRGIMEGSS